MLKYLQQTVESEKLWNLFVRILECFIRSDEVLSAGLNPDSELIKDQDDRLMSLIEGDLSDFRPDETVFLLNSISKEYESLVDNFINCLKRRYLEEAFLKFLAQKSPELYSLIEQNDTISLSTVMENIKLLLQEEVYLWDENSVTTKLERILADLKLYLSLSTLCFSQGISNLLELLNFMRTKWFPEKVKFPLLLTIEVVNDDECKEILIFLRNFLNKKECTSDEKLRYAELIIKRNRELREVFGNSERILRGWVQKNLGYELSKDEAEKVLNQIALDVLSDNLSKIKDKIEDICHKLGRLSLLNSLKIVMLLLELEFFRHQIRE